MGIKEEVIDEFEEKFTSSRTHMLWTFVPTVKEMRAFIIKSMARAVRNVKSNNVEKAFRSPIYQKAISDFCADRDALADEIEEGI